MNIDSVSVINSDYYRNNAVNEVIVEKTQGIQTFKKSNDKEFNKNNAEDQQVDIEKLDKSLNKLNRFLEDESAHAEYSVHEDFGTIMIKIIDDNTKEVILEIPPKKILDMVASMCRQFGLFDKKV